MSKYTTEVRFICENAAGYEDSQGYSKVDDIIEKSREKIFDFEYPIFDASYRSVLETKILRHYYTREIGLETVGLWKHFLNMRMNEIMPYYNKMYQSELLEFNPLYNVRYDTTHKGSASGNSTDSGRIDENIDDTRDTTRSGNQDSMTKFSDTPQGSVDNLRNDKYLTSAQQVETQSNDNSNDEFNRDRNVKTNNEGKFSNTDEYLRHVEGNNGSRTFTELLMQYRDSFLNIDMMVINDLNDLFMGVW